MRPTALAALVTVTLALPAAALEDTPLTAEEFDARTLGQTLTFATGGEPYGIEQYLPGRRVIWAFIGEECREGSWFPVGSQICFEYDDEPGRLHCWTFFDGADGLVARSEGPGGTELVEVRRAEEAMYCPGPDVGA